MIAERQTILNSDTAREQHEETVNDSHQPRDQRLQDGGSSLHDGAQGATQGDDIERS